MKRLISLWLIALIVSLPFPIVAVEPDSPFSSPIGGQTINIGEAIALYPKYMEPTVVRQSLLEQQNIPVFFALRGETLGSIAEKVTGVQAADPLTGIGQLPPIRTITLRPTGTSSSYIAGAPVYIKPKDRIITLDNLGYVIVHLRKQDPTSQDGEPDWFSSLESSTIQLNMTADIVFDLESFQGGFLEGLSSSAVTLREEPDATAFLEKPDKSGNSIFAGRAYIRASQVSERGATIHVYDTNIRPIPLSLNQPTDIVQTSGVHITPGSERQVRLFNTGNPFQDYFRVRLEQVISPQDKVVVALTVEGKTQHKTLVRNMPLYRNSQWYVDSLDIRSQPLTSGNMITTKEGASLDLDTVFNDGAIIVSDEIKERLKDDTAGKEVRHYTLILRNALGEKKVLRGSAIIGNLGTLFDSLQLTGNIAQFIEESYCPGLHERDPQSLEGDYKIKGLTGCLAAVKLHQLITEYGDAREQGTSVSYRARGYEGLTQLYANFLIEEAASAADGTTVKNSQP